MPSRAKQEKASEDGGREVFRRLLLGSRGRYMLLLRERDISWVVSPVLFVDDMGERWRWHRTSQGDRGLLYTTRPVVQQAV